MKKMNGFLTRVLASVSAVAVLGGLVVTQSASAGASSNSATVAASAVATFFATPARESDEVSRSAASRQELLSGEADAIRNQAEALQAAQAAQAAKAAAAAAFVKQWGYQPGTTNPREIARQMMANKYAWGAAQFTCYDNIIMRESRWDPYADNPTSSAYGIPQALPGSRMASAGADWRTNPATQIKWGLGYVKDRFGTPCAAWSFKKAHGWY